MFNFFKTKKIDVSTMEPIICEKYGIEFRCNESAKKYYYYSGSVQWKNEKLYFRLGVDSKNSFSINKSMEHFEKMFENFAWWEENIKQKFLEEIFEGKETASISNWSEWNADDEESWHIKMTRAEFYELINIEDIDINKDGKIEVGIRLDGDGELVSPDAMWVSTEITGTDFKVNI